MPPTRLLFAGRVVNLEIFVRDENASLRLEPRRLGDVILSGESSVATDSVELGGARFDTKNFSIDERYRHSLRKGSSANEFETTAD